MGACASKKKHIEKRDIKKKDVVKEHKPPKDDGDDEDRQLPLWKPRRQL